MALRRADHDAVGLLSRLRRDELEDLPDVLIVGMIGPRSNAYAADPITAEEAHAYYLPQAEALAEAGVDLVTGYTLSGTGEAIGIVRAARDAGVAVGISFTVETDGRLPNGSTLGEAVSALEDAAPADHYLVTCAHPDHIASALKTLTPEQRELIRGVRGNASHVAEIWRTPAAA